MQAKVIIAPKANHLIMVVKICRYLVFVTLKNPKGPTTRINNERAILKSVLSSKNWFMEIADYLIRDLYAFILSSWESFQQGDESVRFVVFGLKVQATSRSDLATAAE
jgi:hypothetical protein